MLRTVPERLPSVHRSSFPLDIRPDSKPDLHGGTMPELLRSKASASALPNPEFPTVPDCSSVTGKSAAGCEHSSSPSFLFHRRSARHNEHLQSPSFLPWNELPFRYSPPPKTADNRLPASGLPVHCKPAQSVPSSDDTGQRLLHRLQLPAVSHR